MNLVFIIKTYFPKIQRAFSYLCHLIEELGRMNEIMESC